MEDVLGFLNFVALLAFCCGLSSLPVQMSRLPDARKGLVLCVSALVLAPIALSEPIYYGIPMACGAVFGLCMPSRANRVRRLYLWVLALAASLVFLDFAFDSGIPRFGLPSLEHLFEPGLVYFSSIEALAGALLVGVAAIVILTSAWWISGLLSGSRLFGMRARRRLIVFAVTSFLCYFVEPQLHGSIQHPLGVHHPIFTFSTLAGGLVGYAALREGVCGLSVFDSSRPLAQPIVAYFAVYHFSLDVFERTAGWMFDMPYAETAAVTFVITLPYGALLRELVLKTRERRA